MSSCSNEEYFYQLDNMVIRSTEHLRQIFKQRWNLETGEDWVDDQNYIQTFLVQHCEKVLKKAIPLQTKVLFASCSLEDWDLSLMSLVLLNFGNEKKHKLQNQAIRQLKDLRNDLAHHKSKKLTQGEYYEKVKLFQGILQILEMKKSEVKTLVKKSCVNSSSEDTERLNLLLKNAEQSIKLQDFENALLQYSEAISIPRLSTANLAVVYEKRAACYLSIKDSHSLDGKHTEQAILDVREALKLYNKSWNAHYLEAQCHKAKNNLSKAISSYEMALAISPTQKQIKKDLDSCKILKSTQRGNAHLNLDQLPVSASDVLGDLANLKDKYGRGLTLTKYFEVFGYQTHPVYVGELYYYGMEVPQDYVKAVTYFTQADKQEFAEGTYKLGLCYYEGHGVPQDIGKAIEIFRRCAGMDPRKRRRFENFSTLGFNQGVNHAENVIGVCYEDGIGVEKNICEAAIWYKRAMEHGNGAGATSLGILYINGNGVPENDKMGEMCCKQGLNFGNTAAAEILVDYYRHQLEPEMAWIMLKIAREMGHSRYLEMKDEEFNRELTMFQSDRCRLEEYVTEFEKKYNVEFKGMTFKQRMDRAYQKLDPNSAKLNNNMINNSCGGQIQRIGKNIMVSVGIKGLHGSQTAIEVLKTMDIIFELNKMLTLQNDLSKTQQLKVIDLFYECSMLEFHLKLFITNVPKFKRIVAELFNETCEEKGEEDMKIRLCYVSYNLWPSLKLSDDLYAFEILKEGIRRYPDNYGYIRVLIYCLTNRRSYKQALQCLNEALEKFPEKVDLYWYNTDTILNSENVEPSKIIDAFKLFLDKAPSDHRFVPEAYYEISFVHMEDYLRHNKANDQNYVNKEMLKLVQENYRLGKEAEKDQLPCYQPYGVSDAQTIVEGFLGKLNDHLNDAENSNGNKFVRSPVPKFESVLKRKEYLQSPVRKGLILQLRERIRDVIGSNQKGLPFDESVVPGNFEQRRAKKMGQLKSITLQEMNPTKNEIFENSILDLTIVDEPIFYSNSIQMVAEDDNGDTTRLYVNQVATENVLYHFAVGSRIAVINPYMGTFAMDEIKGIRVDDQKCIIYLEKVREMCRFCGEENSIRKCSRCKRLYCSRECQKLDWQLFEHNLICSVDPANQICSNLVKF